MPAVTVVELQKEKDSFPLERNEAKGDAGRMLVRMAGWQSKEERIIL